MAAFQRISVPQSRKLIGDKNPVIVDVRDINAHQDGSLPGAQHVTLSNFPSFRKATKRDLPILIYCYHGNASQETAQMFVDFGFSEVYSMDGGYEAWCLES